MLVYSVRSPNNDFRHGYQNKGELKGRAITTGEFQSWVASLDALIDRVESSFISRQTEMLDPLHDPIRMAKQIHTIADQLVRNHPGQSFEDQLNSASPELKTLNKAAAWLDESFSLLSIYFNPEAATFGRQRGCSLHGILKKLAAILRSEDTIRQGPKIILKGASFRNVFVYDSFKLIPFALLTNAIKYSMSGVVEVSLVERVASTEIIVQSTGPLIEDDEKALIFEKRYRGRHAARLTRDGRGVGLYLAAIIARAHDSEIRVMSKRIGELRGDVPLATNVFSIEVAHG
ncbi:ATP-binding protein [Luteibacter jiangsuensis]